MAEQGFCKPQVVGSTPILGFGAGTQAAKGSRL